MARTNRFTTFTDSVFSSMKSRLNAYGATLLNYVEAPSVTETDVKNLLVHNKDREVLDRASRICDIGVREVGTMWTVPDGYRRHTSVGLPNLLFRFKDKVNYIFPNYTIKGPVIEGNEKLARAIDDWIRRRLEAGVAVAKALDTFENVCLRLQTAQEVRYYFPAVMALLDSRYSPAEERLLKKLSAAGNKIPPNVKNLGPEVRSACKEACALIARATMLPRDNPATPPVDLWFSAYTYATDEGNNIA